MTEKNRGANQDIAHRIYFGLFVERLTDLTGQNAFWDIRARSAFSGITPPRTGSGPERPPDLPPTNTSAILSPSASMASNMSRSTWACGKRLSTFRAKGGRRSATGSWVPLLQDAPEPNDFNVIRSLDELPRLGRQPSEYRKRLGGRSAH
jgi:hypothetical protein